MLAMTYDETTKIFNGYIEVDDGDSVPANATLVKPGDDIIQPYTWTGTSWAGQSLTDFRNSLEGVQASVGPTTEQQMINALGQQVATLTATVAKLTLAGGTE